MSHGATSRCGCHAFCGWKAAAAAGRACKKEEDLTTKPFSTKNSAAASGHAGLGAKIAIESSGLTSCYKLIAGVFI